MSMLGKYCISCLGRSLDGVENGAIFVVLNDRAAPGRDTLNCDCLRADRGINSGRILFNDCLKIREWENMMRGTNRSSFDLFRVVNL
jgi:hypothetical protein